MDQAAFFERECAEIMQQVGELHNQDTDAYLTNVRKAIVNPVLKWSLDKEDEDEDASPADERSDTKSDSLPAPEKNDIEIEDIAGSYAQAMMDRAMHIPGTSDRIENIPSEWLSASTCTGCGTFEIALRSVANAVSEHRPVNSDAIAVREVMGCEIEKYKQILLLKHVLTQPETCLYNDVLTLGDDTLRKCIKHDKACVLRKNIFTMGSGFSCKSLSKLQNLASSFKKAMSEKNQESSSFRTFHGTVTAIDETLPLWILLENVDMDCSDEDSNGRIISSILAESGYETRMILLEAHKFGLPQRRVRLFILGIHKGRASTDLVNSPSEILDKAINVYLPAFKTPPRPVDDFLDANDSDQVTEELSRRQKVRFDREKRQADGVDDNMDIDASLKGGKWKEMHMQLAASRGLAWPLTVPPGLQKNSWFLTLTSREQEVVAFVLEKNKDKDPPIRFADLYHSANRTPVSTSDVVPTVLPSGTVWDFKNNRLLTGHEQLALQGIQLEQPNLTNNQAQDVAGNAFPSTVIVALQLAMLCSMEFPSLADDETMDGVEKFLNRILV
eukprot:symbB.v1.2.027404.t1/scaffold2808.1/size69842/6